MRTRRIRSALDRGQWRALGWMAAVIVALHVAGILLLVLVVAGHAGAIAVRTGVAAYTLGLRHAFDADHISAIDNTTRKLMSEGRRPVSVGFWFSLGHSSVVFGLSALFALGMRSVGGALQRPGSRLHELSGIVGTSVSGGFLT
jgi:high-affinity nickel-transport protein